MVERGSQLIRNLEGISARTGDVDFSNLEGLHAIPDVDAEDNAFIRDVLGGKKDTASTAVVDTDSVMSYLKGLLARTGHRQIFSSVVQVSVVATTSETDLSLPDVAVVLVTGLTIKRVTAAVAWRKQVDSSGSTNAINGATQDIQVRDDTPGDWADAITMSDNALSTGGNATEGGMLLVGEIDINSTVAATDTYNFQWNNADVDGNNLTLYDVQTYLIIEYN